jgi:hypothetical protein
MRADGDIYALHDATGSQVAMGSYEVCQTLLYLVTSSPLMERPPRYYEKVAPRQHVRPVAGGAELNAADRGGVKSLNVPRSSKTTDGVKVSASIRRLEAQLPSGRSVGSEEVQDCFLHLPTSAPHARFSRSDADRSGAGPLEVAGNVGANRVSAERKLVTAQSVVQPRKSGIELDAAPYGILGGAYLNSPSASSYVYVGLYVVLVIGSALLMWALFLSL